MNRDLLTSPRFTSVTALARARSWASILGAVVALAACSATQDAGEGATPEEGAGSADESSAAAASCKSSDRHRPDRCYAHTYPEEYKAFVVTRIDIDGQCFNGSQIKVAFTRFDDAEPGDTLDICFAYQSTPPGWQEVATKSTGACSITGQTSNNTKTIKKVSPGPCTVTPPPPPPTPPTLTLSPIPSYDWPGFAFMVSVTGCREGMSNLRWKVTRLSDGAVVRSAPIPSCGFQTPFTDVASGVTYRVEACADMSGRTACSAQTWTGPACGGQNQACCPGDACSFGTCHTLSTSPPQRVCAIAFNPPGHLHH